MADNDNILEGLIASAFAFLEESLNSSLTEYPSRSIVSFVIGVELILKARLVREHWSLILKDPDSTNYNSFCKGNFVSVNITEAIKRIDQICNEKIKKEFDNSLIQILQTRNRIVHFYHDPSLEEDTRENVFNLDSVVSEMLVVWVRLKKNMEGIWDEIFNGYSNNIAQIERALITIKEYLDVKYKELLPTINELKYTCNIEICEACSHESFAIKRESVVPPGYIEGGCVVCGYTNPVLYIKCDNAECSHDIYHIMIEGDQEIVCDSCGETLDVDIEAQLDDETNEHIYCFDCENIISKIQGKLICLTCDDDFEDHEIVGCGFCNQLYATHSTLETSYHTGCHFCEGLSGRHKDD